MFVDAAWSISAGFLTAVFHHFLLSCMVIYGLILARRTWRTLDAMPQPERAAQRLPVIKRSAKRFGVICLVWWCGLTALSYYSDVESRKKASNCKRSTSPEYAELYVAELCYVDGRENDIRSLLRLYDTKTGQILAEEFVFNSEYGLEWRNTRTRSQVENNEIHLIDEPSTPYLSKLGDPSLEIDLPPPWWQRMRAKLP